ncbi:hypothetical protein BZA05DRAFT_418405 [Tricharina praecox]|uniref:uncharacterized protein n=1 Tax=Tricharina praecox TaxID=43433 RepID=UPI002220C824|nr:uncharacterized protein BZA05DRAFT_418405 [Tricharina praecox]KAI5852077.1 hypothetical protein BZA05DRAFT_418405 [Tricharina praecox]
MKNSLTTLPVEVLQLLSTHLTPHDIASLRRVSWSAFKTFASPPLCAFLLHHHFPFAPAVHEYAYDTLNALLLRRRRIVSLGYTQSHELSSTTSNFDGDLGVLVTTTVDEARSRVEISVRWLANPEFNIIVPAPLHLGDGGPSSAPPPEIVHVRDKVLLLYPDTAGVGTLALILDGKEGRTLWSALFNSPILSERAAVAGLRPVFNEHYLAFLTVVAATGKRVLTIARLRDIHKETELITSALPIRSENIRELKADDSGGTVFVAEVFPAHGNLHRIVLVDARTGEATRAFHLPMAPLFVAAERDWGFELTPGEKELVAWQSPRDDAYRAGLALQISVFQLKGESKTSKVRYLRPAPELPSPRAHLRVSYNPALAVATMGKSLLIYPPLNLDHPRAGTGEEVNSLNTLKPLALSTPLHIPGGRVEEITVGLEWLRVSVGGSGSGGTHLLRTSTPLGGAMDELATTGSATPVSGWSTPHSIFGGEGAVVDPRELTKRLAAMQFDGKAAATAGKKRESGLRFSRVYGEDHESDKGRVDKLEDAAGSGAGAGAEDAHGGGRRGSTWALGVLGEKISGALKSGRRGSAQSESVEAYNGSGPGLGRAETVSSGGSKEKKGWKGRLFGR